MAGKSNIPKSDSQGTVATKKDRKGFFILIAVIVVMVVITILILPYCTDLLNGDTREAFVASIRSKGPWGVIILLALQILQVVVAFTPGEVVQIVAGVLYGAVGGWAICTLGTALSSAIVYKLVSKLGMPFVEDTISPKMAKKLDFLKDSKRLDVVMFILFFIPGLPKDVLTYFAPITKMPLKRFLPLTLIARTPALIASTYGGSAWTQGNYGSMAAVFIICGAIGLLGIIFRDRILEFFAKEKEKIKTKRGLSGRIGTEPGLPGTVEPQKPETRQDDDDPPSSGAEEARGNLRDTEAADDPR